MKKDCVCVKRTGSWSGISNAKNLVFRVEQCNSYLLYAKKIKCLFDKAELCDS